MTKPAIDHVTTHYQSPVQEAVEMRELTSAFSNPGKEAIRECIGAESDYIVSNIDQELVPSLRHIALYIMSPRIDLCFVKRRAYFIIERDSAKNELASEKTA